MAGPFTVQRIPRGLLDLLSMKGGGFFPTELMPQVMPSIELLDWYGFELRSSPPISGTAVVNANGPWAAAAATVPPSELWAVYNITVVNSPNFAAGEAYRIHPMLINPGVNQPLVGPQFQSASGITERICIGWDFPKPRLCQPGTQFGAYATLVTAGATSFGVMVDRLVLKI